MDKFSFAYDKSILMLKSLITEYGFIASSIDKDNYKRVFARDGIICGIASLSSGNKELINAMKNTLLTLKSFQGREGEIPSNVDVNGKIISYGGTTGRVDAVLWYIIGVSMYIRKTKDFNLLKTFSKSLEKSIDLLNSWEFNEKNFIYVPQGGDWADEYINEGYVLYDEILYYKALKEYSKLLKIQNKDNSYFEKKSKTIKEMIKINFWPEENNLNSKYIYHKGLFSKNLQRKENRFFIPSFSPGTFNNNFDSFGNSLALIFNIAEKDKISQITSFIKEHFEGKTNFLLPAFSPPIKPKDKHWEILKTNFSYTFKNHPYQYHNGGLWPLTTGFMILALKTNNYEIMAKKYLNGLYSAIELDDWGFNEFLDGKTFQAKGTKHLGFSASSYVIAYNSLIKNKKIFF